MDMLKRLRPDGVLDERTVSQIEDQAKSIVMSNRNSGFGGLPRASAVLPLAAPATVESAVLAVDPIPLPPDSISVSLVAGTMDIKCSFGQLKEIGKRMAAKYRATHQREPPKHRQQIGGSLVSVNTYTEADRGMMEAVIREYMNV